ncbi:glycosyltransferase family 8 protein [Pectinatus frisingensis]|uniref:glycosyltransferase family 8 protein n=1 Tax=Pectinatus frisingensis TaxID=865 RepID=UPI0015F72A2F|nr:glycosyltransferase [Pectinatus frisingensis]
MDEFVIKHMFLQSIIEREKFSFIENEDNIAGHIGYGLDNNAARMTGTSITSICENNKDKKFVFHLLCNNISEENIHRFESLAQQYKIDINMYFLDIKSPLLRNLATTSLFPLPIWYRIFFPYILKTDIFLYLDTDIICIADIFNLFKMSITNEIIGVVVDFKSVREKATKKLKLKNYMYFNSGFMLINIQKWNYYNITQNLLNILEQNKTLLDQDVLNILFSQKPHFYLSDIYNNIGLWCESEEVIKNKLKEIKLIHFANHPKPWSILWQYEKRPYMENIYNKYEKLSPWREMPLELPQNYHHKRWYAEILRNEGKIKESLYWYWQYIKGKYEL